MSLRIIYSSIFILLALLALFIYDQVRFGDQSLHVVFCDVGQGDAVYIRTPQGKDILIDGGPDNSILLCLSENMPFWDKSLDLVILTHPDADHYTGLIPVAREYNVSSFATSYAPPDTPGLVRIKTALSEQGVSVRFVCQGDRFRFPDGVSLEIAWPKTCSIASTDKNDNSVVAVLRYQEFEVLLTGDAEENIGDFYQDSVGDIDILKIPHHGSKDGVDEDYLKAVRPEVAVVSAGEKNRFGHPAREILDLLEREEVKIFRTDKQGNIHIKSNGSTYSIDLLGK
jgi:competence protein ComEC